MVAAVFGSVWISQRFKCRPEPHSHRFFQGLSAGLLTLLHVAEDAHHAHQFLSGTLLSRSLAGPGTQRTPGQVFSWLLNVLCSLALGLMVGLNITQITLLWVTSTWLTRSYCEGGTNHPDFVFPEFSNAVILAIATTGNSWKHRQPIAARELEAKTHEDDIIIKMKVYSVLSIHLSFATQARFH
jgi:hypothetical protein